RRGAGCAVRRGRRLLNRSLCLVALGLGARSEVRGPRVLRDLEAQDALESVKARVRGEEARGRVLAVGVGRTERGSKARGDVARAVPLPLLGGDLEALSIARGRGGEPAHEERLDVRADRVRRGADLLELLHQSA